MWLIITLLIGIVGGLTAIKLKIPAGGIIGALISVAIFSIFSGKAQFPQEFKLITQIGTGAYIGSHIRKKDVLEFKGIIKPAIILSVSLILFSIAISVMLSKLNYIDFVTALFATSPAGLTDMTIISVDFGADSSLVAVLQFIRLISVITIMPSLIKYLMSKIDKSVKEDTPNKGIIEETKNRDETINSVQMTKKTVITLLIGTVLGFIGFITGIPAGVISFAMIGCAVYNVRTSNALIPMNLRKCFQILAGTLIGSKMTLEQVMGMKDILPIIFLIVTGYIVLNLLLAYLLTKYTTLDILTAFYSAAPGGLTDMSIIASEMGADAPKVAALHFVRVVGIIAFYPIVIKLILSYVS